MERIEIHIGTVLPIDVANIDTDSIIPKQFLKSVSRIGFGQHLFDELRYLDKGEFGIDCSKRKKNPDFILNNPIYEGASILLARENFGCGSSREHAPWALLEAGFKILVAPSFADIFFSNCIKNGILPVILESKQVDILFSECKDQNILKLKIDLFSKCITCREKNIFFEFFIDDSSRTTLLTGVDEIEATLMFKTAIKRFEVERDRKFPWLGINPTEKLK